MLIIASDSNCFGGPEADAPQHNALEEGYIALGDPSGPTNKTAWRDDSEGTCYGNGRRYEYEEIPALTKVPSRHDR